MRTLKVHGVRGESNIYIGESLRSLHSYIPVKNTVILTDTSVRGLYEKEFPDSRIIEVGSGEKIKNLNTVRTIYKRLIDMEVDRSSFLVGIGGGVVCDITGFVASTYLRGVGFGFVPSTLLSQVDASVGGKNGVNLDGYKNIVGTFNQPDFVICDTHLLKTLSQKEISNGMAEVVKHTLIGDARLFTFLEKNLDDVLSLEEECMEKIIYDSLVIKTRMVNTDEHERGVRRKLNFGHTLGHAIEKILGVSHGEAVSAGMCFASMFSQKRGYLSKDERERVEKLLMNLGLPVFFNNHDVETIFQAMRKDKKREEEKLHFIFLQGIGNAVIEMVALDELKGALTEIAPDMRRTREGKE